MTINTSPLRWVYVESSGTGMHYIAPEGIQMSRHDIIYPTLLNTHKVLDDGSSTGASSLVNIMKLERGGTYNQITLDGIVYSGKFATGEGREVDKIVSDAYDWKYYSPQSVGGVICKYIYEHYDDNF
ncbi:hypothetical protein N9K20_03000 [Methylophilaceae bacterium]|nr:hypothetical protein [Methylophilaceae bacterium]